MAHRRKPGSGSRRGTSAGRGHKNPSKRHGNYHNRYLVTTASSDGRFGSFGELTLRLTGTHREDTGVACALETANRRCTPVSVPVDISLPPPAAKSDTDTVVIEGIKDRGGLTALNQCPKLLMGRFAECRDCDFNDPT